MLPWLIVAGAVYSRALARRRTDCGDCRGAMLACGHGPRLWARASLAPRLPARYMQGRLDDAPVPHIAAALVLVLYNLLHLQPKT